MTDHLNAVICPGCAEHLSPEVVACPRCGYEHPDEGRMISIGEMMALPSFPAHPCCKFHDVSPAFLKAVVDAAFAAGKAAGEDYLAAELLERGGFATLQLNADPLGVPRMRFILPEASESVQAAKIGGALVVNHR